VGLVEVHKLARTPTLKKKVCCNVSVFWMIISGCEGTKSYNTLEMIKMWHVGGMKEGVQIEAALNSNMILMPY
jgi:hypothetical protein